MEFLLGVITNISLPCFGCFNIDFYTAFDLLNCLLLSFTISSGCMVVLLRADHWVYWTTLLVHSVLATYCPVKALESTFILESPAPLLMVKGWFIIEKQSLILSFPIEKGWF